MASACVNNSIGVSQPSYAWLTPTPRLSFSRDDDSSSKKPSLSSSSSAVDDLEGSDPVDFEFRLEDPVTMLPADELFSDGKLMPLHVSTLKLSSAVRSAADESAKSCDISGMDPYLFSPKAPRCSSRWRELLGFKKLYQNTKSEPTHLKTTSSSSSSTSSNPAKSSLKHFLHRNSKPSSSSSSSFYSLESSLSLPLLKDSDSESVSISSSRLSLSSSSSGHEHEDLPRLSLDSDKPTLNPNPNPFANPQRMRMVKPREGGTNHNQTTGGTSRVGRSPMRRETSSSSTTSRGVSVDSPRMNSSGKIVFQSLERSSSSPSSFNGGPRFKQRGMERSYSANVRVTPVLNVPVCSLRGSSKSGSVFGFGQLFSSSPQKNGYHHHHNHNHHHGNGARQQQQQSNNNNCRNRTDRT
ncbi:hypothetical protein ACOSP7_031216 [Xanthoceras sorbifolium]|uniref:Serine-rich protein n=1 Tax=Xanthoceras sorbifolium TaxID=99658 RepID=A0ABQ8H104_9ROSI|nr:hypothetical protein JRO89_XS15G0054800 [Xanthoceras sorbifolium]